jgi:hypothetical protein
MTSVIAEVIFSTEIATNFAKLVGELDRILERTQAGQRQLNWDYEDIAIFDLPGARFVLNTVDSNTCSAHPSLMISVGPSHIPADIGQIPTDFTSLCVRLVEKVQSRFDVAAILWHECDGVVTPELLDALADAQPELPNDILPGQPIAFSFDDASEILPHVVVPYPTTPVQEKPVEVFHTCNRCPDLARLRDALYPEFSDATALPAASMRLTAQIMNASLVMVWMPFGEDEITYSVPQKSYDRHAMVA